MAKQVHNYKLLNVIGSGEFGKVYKAEHQNTKQTFAVKQITNNIFQQNPKLKEFTVNEIQSLQKIDNPHVVKFIELIQTQNNLYFIYEYCNGGTLEQMIQDKTRLSEQETLDIMKQILQGMLSVVNLNILHRDLKPQNILIHDKIIKIVDFGFCKPIEENSMTKTMLGSPIYMAPEILKGCDYGSQADIWSLGILMYEMLYGFCPYDAKNIAQLISKI